MHEFVEEADPLAELRNESWSVVFLSPFLAVKMLLPGEFLIDDEAEQFFAVAGVNIVVVDIDRH